MAKNIIYQTHFTSTKTHDARRRIFDVDYVSVSRARVKEYADRVGADYVFFDKPLIDFTEKHEAGVTYDKTRLLKEDLFLDYDKVLHLDTDIVPLPSSPSIFDINITHCALAKYWWYDKNNQYCLHRDNYDLVDCAKQHYDVYNVPYPLLDNGLLRWFNSGVMLWTNRGIQEARDSFIPVEDFKTSREIRRLHGDEVYWNTMLTAVDFPVEILDAGWNYLWPAGFPCEPKPEIKFWHYNTCNAKEQIVKQWDKKED